MEGTQHDSDTLVVEAVDTKEVVERNNELTIFNDDVNTFEHVINCLIDVCGHDAIQAEQCTMIIHYNGKCAVKRGDRSKLTPLCTALHDRGLSADITN